MPVTPDDLDQFHRFATTKLDNGGADSLQQLINEFESLREYEQSVAGIRESVTQHEAGESVSAEDAFDEVRQRLGWTK